MAAIIRTCAAATPMLLVSDIGKSRTFYGRALGYSLVGGSFSGGGAPSCGTSSTVEPVLLTGPCGQALRLVPVADGPPGGCVVLCVAVPDREVAARAIMVHGGGRGENWLDDEPLYVGPDGELILLEERGLPGAERVRLVVYDFDGVMTDNRVFVGQDGRETVAANRSDGLGVGMIARLGIDQCILSTETNPVVTARAVKLGLDAETGVDDKPSALRRLALRRAVDLADVLYVGNDINDAGAMALAGFRVAPADAHPDILAQAGYVTRAKGGHGVVRELADLLGAVRPVEPEKSCDQ
jgi:3-deoxy-D-manno-octulosonate 8-phosphate phosphatase (KDO 8-P phosphatase)